MVLREAGGPEESDPSASWRKGDRPWAPRDRADACEEPEDLKRHKFTPMPQALKVPDAKAAVMRKG